MRTILAAFIISVMAATVHAAENTYDFTVTTEGGEILGSGKIHLPFKLGADGEGLANWEFTVTQAGANEISWAGARACLAGGKGKATVECSGSRITLDFNAGRQDNNATGEWTMDRQDRGILYYSDIAGRYPCAFFRISKPAQPNSATNQVPAGPLTNSAALDKGSHR